MVYKYPSDWQWVSIGAGQVWIQDFEKNSHIFTLVLNPFELNPRYNFYGVVYPIHGQLRDYWQAYFFLLGAPVCNEYYWTNDSNSTKYVVQWFEPWGGQYKGIALDRRRIPRLQGENYFEN
jgi:hypothetical protein